MKITYTKQFIKDTKKYPQYKNKFLKVLANFKNKESISGIPNIKKLQSGENDYRLRMGSLRIGFSKHEDIIIFKRFLHRKDIYKYFP